MCLIVIGAYFVTGNTFSDHHEVWKLWKAKLTVKLFSQNPGPSSAVASKKTKAPKNNLDYQPKCILAFHLVPTESRQALLMFFKVFTEVNSP